MATLTAGYPPPQGADLVAPLGAGTLFDVALVQEGGVTLVCKRLVPRMRREAEGKAAMVREAKLLSLARHPSLPALVRAGADGNGPFLLETRADGVSVRDLVTGWKDRGHAVPELLVAHLTRASVLALAELHELADEGGPLGIVHGDLGPDHVLLGPLGEVRFVDFGAARFRGMEEAGQGRGTLPFVAPEVARGEEPPGAAGDVYALGATLLFLALGRPLTSSPDEAAMLLEIGERGLRGEMIEEAPGFTAAEREALRRALSPDPSVRPQTARALLQAMGPSGRGA